MKKILAILLALILVLCLAAPALAVTPALPVPDIPEVPDIGDDITIEIPDDFWDDWFEANPGPPLVPTEPVEEPPVLIGSGWIGWLRDLFRWGRFGD